MTYEEYTDLEYPIRVNAFRNLVSGLSLYRAVDIHWERTNHGDEESSDEWTVDISVGRGKCVVVKSCSIEEAIVSACHKADEKEDELEIERKIKRGAALSKLTQEEIRLLGIA